MNQQLQFANNNPSQHLFRFLDALFIFLSLYLSLQLLNIDYSIYFVTSALTVILFFYLLSEMLGLYRYETYHIFKPSLKTVILSSVLTFVSLLVIAYAFDILRYFNREIIGLWFLTMLFSLIGWRWFLCQIQNLYFSDSDTQRNFAILGANTIGSHIAETIINDLAIGYNFLGFYDDRAENDERIIHALGKYKHLGSFDDAVNDAKNGKVEVLYIVLPMVAEYRIANLLNKLSDATAEVHIIPNFFIYNLLHSRWHNVGSYLALSIYDTPFYGVGSVVKRAEDLVLGSIILTLISVPMLFIALAVKLTSKGPVIFKQKRYGLNGEKVTVWKFRSMTVCENQEDDLKQATKNDPRITPLGAFLRRTSLDELPQFINVLQGTMSIVGPRPHAVAHNEFYRKEIDGYMLRHMVKPGITGLAQVKGFRGETKDINLMKERIRYDLEYIRTWSLFLDLKIIFLTIFKGFRSENAY